MSRNVHEPYKASRTGRVTSREGRVSRNLFCPGYVRANQVTSREGRVSRNRRIHQGVSGFSVTSREGRVSRNRKRKAIHSLLEGHVP